MITEYGIEAKSNAEIISELGSRFKDYRLFSDMTQREVAEKSGVSIFTISQFEKGEAKNIGYGTILSLLRSIGFLSEAEKILPKLPEMPKITSYKLSYGTNWLACCRGTKAKTGQHLCLIKSLLKAV